MLENIKLDIIYYNTPKDFEVEFNLCGCCRMRLLTAMANDIKSFISAIKVAVSRSRIVLLCGKLHGDDGLFNIISKAVGREFEEVNNSLYGIAGDGKSRLLKQSIPLVTANGTLLGCVIEQGPQAIIMISEDKNGRKEVMQNLIHPYIKELSKSEPEAVSSSPLQPQEAPDSANSEIVLEPNSVLNSEDNLIHETDLNLEVITDMGTAAHSDDNETISQVELEQESESESESESKPQTETVIENEFEAEDKASDEPEVQDEDEPETVSIEDFNRTKEINQSESSEKVPQESFAVENEEIKDSDTSDNQHTTPDSGLVFAIPDSDLTEEESSLFSSDALKEYNESFSLIGHFDDDNYGHQKRTHGKRRSPMIPILLALVLCLIAVIIYFLLIKPMQSGIDVGENFNNLFSLVLKENFVLWKL